MSGRVVKSGKATVKKILLTVVLLTLIFSLTTACGFMGEEDKKGDGKIPSAEFEIEEIVGLDEFDVDINEKTVSASVSSSTSKFDLGSIKFAGGDELLEYKFYTDESLTEEIKGSEYSLSTGENVFYVTVALKNNPSVKFTYKFVINKEKREGGIEIDIPTVTDDPVIESAEYKYEVPLKTDLTAQELADFIKTNYAEIGAIFVGCGTEEFDNEMDELAKDDNFKIVANMLAESGVSQKTLSSVGLKTAELYDTILSAFKNISNGSGTIEEILKNYLTAENLETIFGTLSGVISEFDADMIITFTDKVLNYGYDGVYNFYLGYNNGTIELTEEEIQGYLNKVGINYDLSLSKELNGKSYIGKILKSNSAVYVIENTLEGIKSVSNADFAALEKTVPLIIEAMENEEGIGGLVSSGTVSYKTLVSAINTLAGFGNVIADGMGDAVRFDTAFNAALEKCFAVGGTKFTGFPTYGWLQTIKFILEKAENVETSVVTDFYLDIDDFSKEQDEDKRNEKLGAFIVKAAEWLNADEGVSQTVLYFVTEFIELISEGIPAEEFVDLWEDATMKPAEEFSADELADIALRIVNAESEYDAVFYGSGMLKINPSESDMKKYVKRYFEYYYFDENIDFDFCDYEFTEKNENIGSIVMSVGATKYLIYVYLYDPADTDKYIITYQVGNRMMTVDTKYWYNDYFCYSGFEIYLFDKETGYSVNIGDYSDVVYTESDFTSVGVSVTSVEYVSDSFGTVRIPVIYVGYDDNEPYVTGINTNTNVWVPLGAELGDIKVELQYNFDNRLQPGEYVSLDDDMFVVSGFDSSVAGEKSMTVKVGKFINVLNYTVISEEYILEHNQFNFYGISQYSDSGEYYGGRFEYDAENGVYSLFSVVMPGEQLEFTVGEQNYDVYTLDGLTKRFANMGIVLTHNFVSVIDNEQRSFDITLSYIGGEVIDVIHIFDYIVKEDQDEAAIRVVKGLEYIYNAVNDANYTGELGIDFDVTAYNGNRGNSSENNIKLNLGRENNAFALYRDNEILAAYESGIAYIDWFGMDLSAISSGIDSLCGNLFEEFCSGAKMLLGELLNPETKDILIAIMSWVTFEAETVNGEVRYKFTFSESNTREIINLLKNVLSSDDARIISKVFEIFESVTGFDFESDFSAEFVFGMNEEGETRYLELSARQDMDKYSLGLRINEFGSSYIELDGTDELIIENKDVTGSIEIIMPKTDINITIDYTLHLGDGFKRQGNSLLSGKAYIEGIFVGEIALTNDALYFDFNLDPYIGSIIDGFGGGAVFRGGTEGFNLCEAINNMFSSGAYGEESAYNAGTSGTAGADNAVSFSVTELLIKVLSENARYLYSINKNTDDYFAGIEIFNSLTSDSLVYVITEILGTIQNGDNYSDSAYDYSEIINRIIDLTESANSTLITEYGLASDFDLAEILFGVNAEEITDKLYLEIGGLGQNSSNEIKFRFTPVVDGGDEDAYLIISVSAEAVFSDESMTVTVPQDAVFDAFTEEDRQNIFGPLLEAIYARQ